MSLVARSSMPDWPATRTLVGIDARDWRFFVSRLRVVEPAQAKGDPETERHEQDVPSIHVLMCCTTPLMCSLVTRPVCWRKAKFDNRHPMVWSRNTIREIKRHHGLITLHRSIVASIAKSGLSWVGPRNRSFGSFGSDGA